MNFPVLIQIEPRKSQVYKVVSKLMMKMETGLNNADPNFVLMIPWYLSTILNKI